MPKEIVLSRESPVSTKNYILNSLPAAEFERLLPDLEPVKVGLGAILYRPEQTIEYVYFPNDAMASIVATTTEGQSAETGVVGREGIVGVDVLMGSDISFNETFIQLAGGGLRMKTSVIRERFKEGGALQNSILKFIRLMMLQISQTALCNRLHTVEERLARWLLLCHDRAASDKLHLTQEFLGIMLGANRSTVTTAAITLQGGGFIKYSRGLITILDRAALEHFSCDCYRTVKEEYDRVQK